MELLQDRLSRTSEIRIWSDNLIILGDMNLYRDNDTQFDLLINNGFVEVDEIRDVDTTTAASDNIYDHIFFYENGRFPPLTQANNAGVFNMFDTVFTDDEHDAPHYAAYIDALEEIRIDAGDGPYANRQSYYNIHWRTRQMSDHYPIWVEMLIDSSDAFLRRKLSQFDNL